MIPRHACAGLVLAGGQAARMGGGDKGRLEVGGQSILARLVAALDHQVAALALSANGDAARWNDLALPVLPDEMPGLGPLGGLLAGLGWAAREGYAWLLTAPTDTPFLPDDLRLRLGHALSGGGAAAIASSGGHRHHVAGLWSVALLPVLRRFLLVEGQRKVGAFAALCGAVSVAWPAEPFDPFLNVNTAADLETANRMRRAAPLAGAVVLAPDATGYRLLEDFAAWVTRQGAAPGGVLQRGSKRGGDRPEDVVLAALDNGETYPVMQRLGKSGACAVDPHGLCAATAALRRAVERRLAPVFVNKFGPMEADGLGLADEMLAVMAEGLPLLTTVSETRLDAWLAFCGGHCTLLDEDFASLTRWGSVNLAMPKLVSPSRNAGTYGRSRD